MCDSELQAFSDYNHKLCELITHEYFHIATA